MRWRTRAGIVQKGEKMVRILVIHGPNLDLLGKRQPEVYGKTDLAGINRRLQALAKSQKVHIEIMQSSHEGQIIEAIGKAYGKFAAIVINPAAYTHTSVGIRDAIAAVNIPVVEVHLSNIYAREEFRHKSMIAPVASGQISGFGVDSYLLGLMAVIGMVRSKR
jgi:3-dehydroquinate dehydratase-2